MDNNIIIRGLCQNNLKNVSLSIPKNKNVVFTGVSGSGKSSIVFDTIAAESQRQMNETYSAWIRGRLPKYEKPRCEFIDNLNPSVIVDQSRLGGNARSTVGTISEMYSALRLLFSRIGEPKIGPASYFSFNNPNGMCKTCAGIGKVMDLNIEAMIDPDKSFEEGMLQLPAFGPGKYYWRVYNRPDLFDVQKKWRDFTEREKNILLYGSETVKGERLDKRFEGVKNQFERLCLMKGAEEQSDNILRKIRKQLDALMETGLPYLSLGQPLSTLSGGERQRVKLAKELGRKGSVFVLDEPTTGLHAADIQKIMQLLEGFVERGNTVIVIEHNTDVMKMADYIIDVGPDGGTSGGEIVFTGTPQEMIDHADTITAKYLRKA